MLFALLEEALGNNRIGMKVLVLCFSSACSLNLCCDVASLNLLR
jgi:hypothetical protein